MVLQRLTINTVIANKHSGPGLSNFRMQGVFYNKCNICRMFSVNTDLVL